MNIDTYFQRIDFDGSAGATLDVLREIHNHHPLAIPFENLNSFLGGEVSIDPEAVFHKLVVEGRGGYCFEQNLLFYEVLKQLGFEVTTHAARVVWRGEEKSQVPRTHMLLKVSLDNVDWIADVGFGGLTMTAPLLLDTEEEQQSPHEKFRVSGDGDDYIISAKLGDAWHPMYVFDLSAHHPVDFAMANYFVSTHTDSLFTSNLVVARPFRNGRHGLLNNVYVKYNRLGQKSEKVFDDTEELLTLLNEIFKIRLERTVDTELLRNKLATLLAKQREIEADGDKETENQQENVPESLQEID